MPNHNPEIVAANNESQNKSKLILGIIFDCIGFLSYLVPVFAEAIDIIWAPISAILVLIMYKGTIGKVAGVISFIEELLPFIDFIPTFTLTWIYKYKILKEQ